MCWYIQSAAYTSHAFGATRSGWWMNGKVSTILTTSCRSFLELRRLKHWKIRIAGRQWDSNFPRKKETQYTKRKTESWVFSGFGISLVWEWKSTTGRFATSRFWPFTWKTSSVGKFNKWEFCKLKITTIVVFVIMIQRIFRLKSQRKRTIFIYCCFCNHDSTHVSILRVSANALYDYYSRIADLFIFIH